MIMVRLDLCSVMPALVAGIHAFRTANKTWMAGTSLDKPGHDDM
jgi:hypothetical protein